MTISVLHLCWIIPVSMVLGMVLFALLDASDHDRWY